MDRIRWTGLIAFALLVIGAIVSGALGLDDLAKVLGGAAVGSGFLPGMFRGPSGNGPGPSSLLLLALLAGCSGSALKTHARVVGTTAQVTNTVTAELEEAYLDRQYDAIKTACGTLDPTKAAYPCKTQAAAALLDVRERWRPVWDAHDTLRGTHTVYREAILTAHASGDMDPDFWVTLLVRLVRAYSALALAASGVGVELPDLPESVGRLAEVE